MPISSTQSFGIISETNKINTVIIPETIPTAKSSVSNVPKISYESLFIDE